MAKKSAWQLHNSIVGKEDRQEVDITSVATDLQSTLKSYGEAAKVKSLSESLGSIINPKKEEKKEDSGDTFLKAMQAVQAMSGISNQEKEMLYKRLEREEEQRLQAQKESIEAQKQGTTTSFDQFKMFLEMQNQANEKIEQIRREAEERERRAREEERQRHEEERQKEQETRRMSPLEEKFFNMGLEMYGNPGPSWKEKLEEAFSTVKGLGYDIQQPGQKTDTTLEIEKMRHELKMKEIDTQHTNALKIEETKAKHDSERWQALAPGINAFAQALPSLLGRAQQAQAPMQQPQYQPQPAQQPQPQAQAQQEQPKGHHIVCTNPECDYHMMAPVRIYDGECPKCGATLTVEAPEHESNPA